MTPPSRLLIVRLSALGDIVHALPVLAAIKRQWPQAEIDWLVEEAYAPILAITEGLRRRVIVRARESGETPDAIAFGGAWGYARAIWYLRHQQYDAALDLQGLIKSAMWAGLSGAARVIGFNRANLREPLAAMFYSECVSPQETKHVIGKNLSILYGLGTVPGAPEFRMRPQAAAAVSGAIAAAGGPGRYVVLNPGAAWPNKRWPAERFGELAAALLEKTGLHSLVSWGPAERELAEAVSAASSGAAVPAPPTEVADLAVLMRDAALVVAGDTGPLHIAAAMGTPLVGLYGPTWPERNGPWAPDDEVISRASACNCHYKRRCQRSEPCIDRITLDDVVAAAQRRLAKAGRA